jgi:hypothetical protein
MCIGGRSRPSIRAAFLTGQFDGTTRDQLSADENANSP